ncbi:MAG: leucine-rich repeat protein [Verrucomicrobiota bacterium]
MKSVKILAAISLLSILQFASGQPAGIRPDSIIVYRADFLPAGLAGTGNVVLLDEYDTYGNLIQSIPMPTSTSGANHRLVAAGDAIGEGGLSRSADGRFLVVSGYDAPVPYPANISGTAGTSIRRVIGRIDHLGYVDTTTALTDFASTGSPRSVVSTDGSAFWMTGSKGGVRYAPFGATTSTQLNNDATDPSQLGIFGGWLYQSTAGASPGISSVGMNLPTTGGQTLNGLPGFPDNGSPDGFHLADLSSAVSGFDTLYVADDTIGLQKFSLVNTFWVSNGSIGEESDHYRGLTAKVTNGGVVLYAIREALGAAGGGELVKLTDSSGYNGAFTGTPAVLATAVDDVAFRGVSLAPFSRPDLTVEVSAPTHATTNVPFNYTFTVRNTGNAPASGITVSFSVPTGLVVDNGPDADGFTGPGAAGSAHVVEFTNGSLAPGSTATLVLSCSAPAAGTFLTDAGTPTTDPAGLIEEGNEENNGAFARVRTVASSSPPEASVFTWNDGFSGSWSDGTKWANELGSGTIPDALGRSNYILNFDVSESYFAHNDLSSGISFDLNQMNFSGSHVVRVAGNPIGFMADGGTLPSITQSGSVAADVRTFVYSDADLTVAVNGSGALTFSAGIQGSDSLVKTGPGKLLLTSGNYYPGTLRIEGGVVALTGESGPTQLIADESFERPHFGAEGWAYRPDFTGWTMTGNSGVASRYSAFVDETRVGSQVAFLQGEPSSISRTIEVNTPGEYRLSFLAGNRPSYGANGLILKIGGNQVGSWDDTQFNLGGNFAFKQVTLNLDAGSYTLAFEGWNTAGGDVATNIDAVTLTGPIGKLPVASGVDLAAGAVLDIGSTEQTVWALDGAAGSSIINNGYLTVDAAASTGFDGVISGSGGFSKMGSGTLTFGGLNTYSGETSVNAGTLRLTAPSLADSSELRLSTGSTLDLTYPSGTPDTVGALYIDDVQQVAGTWGGLASSADNKTALVTGTGVILVVTPPQVPDIALAFPDGTDFADGGTLDFGIIEIGTPGDDTRIIHVKNEGNAELYLDAFFLGVYGVNAADFEVFTNGFTDDYYYLSLSPGATGTILVRFSPTAPGERIAELLVYSDDPDEGSYIVNLTGGAPAAPVFTSQPGNFSIDYHSQVNFVVAASGVPAPDFQWYEGTSGDTSNPISGAFSASYQTPALLGSASYWVRATNASGSADSDTAVVTVGAASLAEIEVAEAVGSDFFPLANGDPLDFGNGELGFTIYPPIKTLMVANFGSETLENLQVTVTGPDAADFGVTLTGIPDDFPTSMGSGNSGFFTVYFTPTTEGPRTATLNIFSNDAGENPFTLTLTGEGVVPVPAVSTSTVTGVTDIEATIHGTVNPNGFATTAKFEFGTTTGYGNTLNLTLSPDDGTAHQDVSAVPIELTPGETYHFRVVATNEWGTAYGEDRTFTTLTEPIDFTYLIGEGEVTITGYTGPGGAVAVPDTIGGLPVVGIEGSAFEHESSITSITLPEGIGFIGSNAFFACDGLTSFTIPDSVTHIGSGAFSLCNGITQIEIPANVSTIDTGAFAFMGGLTQFTVDPLNTEFSALDGVLFNFNRTTLLQYPGGLSGPYSIPPDVTHIGDSAFASATGLTAVTFTGDVTSIGRDAFANTGLTGVMIPASVTVIGPGAFAGCSNLLSIDVNALNGSFESINGVLFDEAQSTLLQYPAGKPDTGYVFPTSVSAIGQSAFFGATHLTGVTMSAGLLTIGDFAFYGCSNLESVVIPAGVTVINIQTFAYCNKLASVTLPAGLVTIGPYAFQSCGSLVNITIPASVTLIEYNAFLGCGNLELATFLGNAPVMGDGVFDGADASFHVGYYEAYEAGFIAPTWPAGIPVVNLDGPPPFTYTISGGQVTITGYTGTGGAVVISNTIEGSPVVAIGPNAFAFNNTITSVVIPAGVLTIGNGAFHHCANLTAVTIPDTVTFIGSLAFRGCGMTQVSIPASVTFISIFAFDLMPNLQAFTVDPANPTYSSLDGVLFNKNQTTLIVYPGGLAGPCTIPTGVTRIDTGAFYFCNALTAVTIPNTVTSIGYAAFEQCDGLTSVVIPASVTSIDTAFSECNSLVSISVDAANPSFTGLDGVLFNKDLTTLLQYPAGKAGNYTVPATVTAIGAAGFLNADNLTGVTLPSGLTSLGWSAFYSCGNLTSINILGGVLDIGPTTFTYCDKLVSVILNEGLVSIGNSAFQGCKLAIIIIPSTVTSIGNQAFMLNTTLTRAVFLGAAPSMGTNVFQIVGSGFFVGYFNGFGAGYTGPPWPGYPVSNLGVSDPIIRVDQPLGSQLAFYGQSRHFGTVFPGSPSGTTKTFTVRNLSYESLTNFDVTVGGANAADFSVDASGLPGSLEYHGSGEITVTFNPTAAGDRSAVLIIESNDSPRSPFTVNLTGTGGSAPSITTQPANQSLPFRTEELTLSVGVDGFPMPDCTWYRGNSGDTSDPISDGEGGSVFTTEAPTSETRYWVRLINAFGSVDSDTVTVTILPPPPTHAILANLEISPGSLAPAFDRLVTTYSATVVNSVSGIVLTPTTEDPLSTITVNGSPVATGTPSGTIFLNVGNNVITTEVTSRNGANKRTYTLTVTRAGTAGVATNPVEMVDARTVLLKGTVMPDGVATVYFEYGPTTGYGDSTPGQVYQSTQSVSFSTMLAGLAHATEFHVRAVATGPFGTLYGNDVTFNTAAEPPLAATGDPSAVNGSAATLVGAVDPKGLSTEVFFQYGLTTLYGKKTEPRIVTSAGGVLDILAPHGGLIPGAIYHYRIVASNAAGTTYGNDVAFLVAEGSGVTDPIPTTSPTVATGDAAGVGTGSAILLGMVNPNRGTTLVQFQFGTTSAYGLSTKVQGVGNGSEPVELSIPIGSLRPATTYHYRLVASNSAGPAFGTDATFTTSAEPPSAVTGNSEVMDSTSVRINGSVRAGEAPAYVFVDFGTDPTGFSDSTQGSPEAVEGAEYNPVSAELHDLGQGRTYYYRVRAVRENGDTDVGETKSFDVATLSGLIQQFPENVFPEDRQGSLSVVILPPLPTGGWRFLGEKTWRPSEVPATGLTTGDRGIEFRPVAGYLQPSNETVAVTSNGVVSSITRNYTLSDETGSGSVNVTLRPEGLTEDTRPFESLAQWAMEGDLDGFGQPVWRDSGTTKTGLLPGNHVLIAKPVTGRGTPSPITVRIRNGETTSATVTYYVAGDETGAPPEVVDFETVSTSTDLPYAWVGQFRSDVGAGSGFVVRPGVVATAGHVLFDDGTLSSATNMQWLHRQDHQVHDPVPLNPRGYFLLTGYAAQRAIDDSPGSSTPESQNLDAAAAYFLTDPGNDGFSGYLASDANDNEFLLSTALKTLVGYPVDGIAAPDLNRMHATSPADVAFTRGFGRTYITSDIRSSGGGSGGPLFVQYENGSYYPAAIYLGGTAQTVVRAIDGDVAGLIGFAESSAAANSGNTGGELTDEESVESSNPLAGDLEVRIEPASAREAGAGWRIQAASPYLASGAVMSDLDPNTYTVRFATIPGFVPPTPQTVEIEAGFRKRITFTYEEIVLPPVIDSPPDVTGMRWEWFVHQIEASHSPTGYSLRGELPWGLWFDDYDGAIYGEAYDAGSYEVMIGASNSGGADSKPLKVVILPRFYDQTLTVPFHEPMFYQIESSEGGDGVLYGADNLPSGLSLNPATGVIEGTPDLAGTFQVPIRVTRRGATAEATLEMNITGTPPEITSESTLYTIVDYGGQATLGVTATGEPEPGYQWFIGSAGDTSQPVDGANAPTFTTPPMTGETNFWVLVSSISGSVGSSTFTVGVYPSANANLSDLVPSVGHLFPAFNAGIAAYSLAVPNEVSTLTLTPFAEVPLSTVTINEAYVALENPSEPIDLVVGSNTVVVRVIADDGTSEKTYTLTIVRGEPPTVATEAATDITYNSAILRGTAKPNGFAQVFFEYGTTLEYGDSTALQEISGSSELDIQAALSGLQAETLYHFRIAVTTGAGTIYGDDMTFETPIAPPLVATGDATDETPGKVKLIGAVDSSGNTTTAYFQFGQTIEYGFTTPVQVVPAGVVVTDIQFTAEGLVEGATYHYRLVATTSAGIWFGEDVVFIAGQATGGSGIPTGAPLATTGGVTDASTGSVNLLGNANPRGGTTFVRFDYGLTDAYGSSTVSKGIGNGSEAATVLSNVTGLLPGRTYHYRVVASNSLGTTSGQDATFNTGFLSPLATTGAASPLSPTSARISGSVRPRGAEAEVFLEYGTDGVNFPDRILATPDTVGGDAETPVHVDLTNLERRVTYYYRLVVERVNNPASKGIGEVKTLEADALHGLVQKFSREVEATSHQSILMVNLLPSGTGAWRFVGETDWRPSGVPVGGLTTGDRLVEYLPVPGFIQPPREQVGIVSGEEPQVIERSYYLTNDAGDATLRVILGPDGISTPSVPLSNRAQWRLIGETAWRATNTAITGLPPGNYLIECKSIPGRNTPPGASTELINGQTKTVTVTYPPANAPILNPPVVIPFATSSGTRNFPYSFVGQFRTDAGSQSGFVVKPRVVATTSLAIFNDTTLTRNTGMQWLLQRDNGTYEPNPQVPRGTYVFSGYDAQRISEGTPGTLSMASQNLNVAALYFAGDAGRGGFSGYLASDKQANEFLQSTALKTMVGYPVNGVSDAFQGRMHATPLSGAMFGWELGRTYGSTAIRGLGGMEGGPLCVRLQQGAYFPAAIYLGGTSKSVVRAIDGDVVDMFNRAEISSNGGDNNTGGGITHSSFTSIGATTAAALKVSIQPAAARDGGAGWRLSPETSYRLSGAQKTGLAAGKYNLELKAVAGFETPATQSVTMTSGQLTEITFTYQEANIAPTVANVTNLAINEDGSTGPLAITLFDADDAEISLDLTATSSNTALVPNGNITLGGSGRNRTVAINPAANQSGSAVITLKVSDGKLNDTDTFTVTVNPVNDAPTISAVSNQSIGINSSTGTIAFTVGDVETAASSLTLSGGSSNTLLTPVSGIVFGGSGASRTVIVTPLAGLLGNSTITLSVSDGNLTTHRTFTLTVGGSALENWRFVNFGTTSNSGDAADSADPDGDGQTNRAEYAAGTNPNQAGDVFRISSATRIGTVFSTSVPGKTGRTYVLQRRAELSDGPWENVAGAGPLAADGLVTLTDAAADGGKGFYRVAVGLAPP